MRSRDTIATKDERVLLQRKTELEERIANANSEYQQHSSLIRSLEPRVAELTVQLERAREKQSDAMSRMARMQDECEAINTELIERKKNSAVSDAIALLKELTPADRMAILQRAHENKTR